MAEVNPEWYTPETHEIAETHIDLLTGEVTQKTVGEVIEDYQKELNPPTWDKKRIWVLNYMLGYRRYL